MYAHTYVHTYVGTDIPTYIGTDIWMYKTEFIGPSHKSGSKTEFYAFSGVK